MTDRNAGSQFLQVFRTEWLSRFFKANFIIQSAVKPLVFHFTFTEAMTWFQEMKPFFVVMRAYGTAPYSFVNGEICSSKKWRIYAFICIIARICMSTIGPYLINAFHMKPMPLPLPVYVMHALSMELGFLIEGFASTRSFNELRSAIDLIDDYDRAFRVNFAKRSLVVWSWLMLAAPGTNWVLGVFVSNIHESKVLKTLSLYVYFLIWMTGWFGMIFKFTATVNIIHRRFQHLHTVITAEQPTIIYGPGGNWRRPVRLSDIGRLHGNLISAAILVNSMHNSALLVWLGEIIIHFTLKLQHLFSQHTTSIYSNSWLSFITMAVNMTALWYLCFCCHRASEAANKIGYMALSTRSCVLRNRFRYERDENFFVGQHFIKNPLSFSAGYGFFTVDLHLLKTMLATVTTLVVNFTA